MTRTDESALHLPRLQAGHLARFVLGFVALAALAGWSASFVGLHGFALSEMHGYSQLTAWLVPGSFDGAAFACSVLVYRASIFGRSALRGRVLMYGFTLLSGWINWHFQTNSLGQYVASALPFAAMLVFDTILSDLRAEWETRHGRQAFRLRLGLLGLRWLVDRRGTATAFRATITAVPVTDLVGLGALAGTSAVPPAVPWSAGTTRVDESVVPESDTSRSYRGPVPPFTGTTDDVVDGTGTVRHRYQRPVPPVTAPRNSGTTDRPTTGGTATAMPLAPPPPAGRPVERYPETTSEQTMIIPKVREDTPDPRKKVTSTAGQQRRLVSVNTPPLGSGSTNEALAAAVRAAGGMSRRKVMTSYGVGTSRAAAIIRLSEEGDDHAQAPAG